MTNIADDLLQYAQGKQELVNDSLRSALAAIGEGCPKSLLEAMRYSLLSPGKRLRPILVFLAAEAAGGDDQIALPGACAVEMIHTYSLVHDDLPSMDDDDLRRGQPTSHKKFNEATAILVGDALQSLAFEFISSQYPPQTAAVCCRELAIAAGAAGMVGGQVEDLTWQDGAATLEALESLHGKKTGALFRACLRLGVLAAQSENPDGPNEDLLSALDEFGRCFGLVFQITDDLLDVEGNVEETGKNVQKDAGRGKLTYPGILGVEESRRRAGELFQEAKKHVAPLGKAGERLQALFRFVLDRDH